MLIITRPKVAAGERLDITMMSKRLNVQYHTVKSNCCSNHTRYL